MLVATCRRWSAGASEERRWVIRHPLRSAVKRGDRDALALLGFSDPGAAELSAFEIRPARPRIGDDLRVSFAMRNSADERAAFNADLRVHFVKASGRTSPKVFKVRQVDFDPGELVVLSNRSHSDSARPARITRACTRSRSW